MVGTRVVVLAAALAVSFVAACGPSSGQVRQAREARYDAAPEVLFRGVLEAVERVQRIDDFDAQRGLIQTESRWYDVDGTYASRDKEGNARVADGAVLLSILVAVKGDPGAWYVEATPIVYQHQAGSPQARELKPGDPQMPGWVQGKVDNVYLAVHERLKAYVVGPASASAP